jgi:hypothetical protein
MEFEQLSGEANAALPIRAFGALANRPQAG